MHACSLRALSCAGLRRRLFDADIPEAWTAIRGALEPAIDVEQKRLDVEAGLRSAPVRGSPTSDRQDVGSARQQNAHPVCWSTEQRDEHAC